MITAWFYPLLLCFVSGFTACLLFMDALWLGHQHRQHQFQRTFAAVLLMLAVGFLNNFVVLACHHLSAANFINSLLLLYDYVVVGGYMMFVVTLVFPGRYKAWQLALLEVPYVAAILLFAITRSPLVYNLVQVWTFVVSTVLFVWLTLSIRRYHKLLRDNVGNLEYFDLRWGAILVGVMYAVQLAWAVESHSQLNWFVSGAIDENLQFDILWCIISIAYVQFILRKIVRQQVFVVPPQEEAATDTPTYYKSLDDKDIDTIIKKKGYYRDPTLTLQKLATHMGTNRQYLSNYINREKQKTFYEYINDLRMEEAKHLLDGWEPGQGQTIENIATQSGFNSYSTFLRQFVRRYGATPSRYLKKD